MNSWPTTRVDWAQLAGRLRDGDLVCVVHGRVDAVLFDGDLPVCPHCAQLLSRAVRDRRTGQVVTFVEPRPRVCPAGHRLAAGDLRLSWRSCACATAVPGPGGHRTWACRHCPGSAPMAYPVCVLVDEPDRLADH